MYQDLMCSRFIKKDCRYLDMVNLTCKLAEMEGVSRFPDKECIDCLVALHRLRVEMFREAMEQNMPVEKSIKSVEKPRSREIISV